MQMRGVVVPPPLPGPRETFCLRPVMLAAAGVVLATIVAGAVMSWRLPFSPCGFRLLTGVPCPGCGGTRSLAALAQLDIREALAWNPLVAAVAILAVVGAVFATLAQCVRKGGIVARWERRIPGSRSMRWVMLVLVVANWVYLIRALP